jgi:hypothetical protein
VRPVAAISTTHDRSTTKADPKSKGFLGADFCKNEQDWLQQPNFAAGKATSARRAAGHARPTP